MSDWGNYIKQAEFLEMAEKVAPALDDLVMFAARRMNQEPKAAVMKKNVGMKKEGFGRLAAGLTGAGLGGVAGAAGASEGNKLRGALTGAALGAAGGVAARKGAQHLLAKPTAKKLVSLGWKKGTPLTGSAAEEGRSALQRYQTGLGIGAGAGGIGAGAVSAPLTDKTATLYALQSGPEHDRTVLKHMLLGGGAGAGAGFLASALSKGKIRPSIGAIGGGAVGVIGGAITGDVTGRMQDEKRREEELTSWKAQHAKELQDWDDWVNQRVTPVTLLAARRLRDEAEIKQAALSLGKVASEEVLAGGKADYRSNSDFSSKQLEDGQKVEMEHTHAPLVAKEIARDHLAEIPDYYTRLDDMEEEAKRDGSFIDTTKQASLDRTLGLLYRKYGPPLQKHASSLFYELDKTQLDSEALGSQFCKLAKATGVDPWSMARQIVTSYPNVLKTAASSFSPEQELASFYVTWAEELIKGAGLLSKGDQPKLEQGERYA